MPTDTDDKVVEIGTATDTSAEVEVTEPRPDLVWDDQARGLCARVHQNGSKSFIFVYRIDDRQRFMRIGKTPVWSLEAARKRAKKLRAIVDQGHDPATYHRQAEKVMPVENVIQYIAGQLQK
jgi:Arm DNA-binding domain